MNALVLYTDRGHEEKIYTVEECEEGWKQVLVLPSLLGKADIGRLVRALRWGICRGKKLQAFVVDTGTSVFGSPQTIGRGVAALPAPVPVLAYGGCANWLSGFPNVGKVLIVDPVPEPEYDLAALPSFQDQYFRSEILRKVRRPPLSSHESSLSQLLTEACSVSLLELAHLQGLPPALSLNVPALCYRTAHCLSAQSFETLTLREPYRRLQPWPSREDIVACLMEELLAE